MSELLRITGTVDTIHYGDPKKTKLDLTLDLSVNDAISLVRWHGQKLNFDLSLASPMGPLFDDPPALGQYCIDGEIFPIQADRLQISGSELREIAGLELVAPLWLVVVSQDPEQLISEYEVIEPTAMVYLTDGERFVSVLSDTSELSDVSDSDDGSESDDAATAAALAVDLVTAGANGRGGE